MNYQLFHTPWHIQMGSLRKTNKCVLLNELEKKVNVQPSLPQLSSSPHSSTVQIFDAMALIYMMKSAGAVTFGDMASKYYQMITRYIGPNGCQRVDVVFDKYINMSIKSGERMK